RTDRQEGSLIPFMSASRTRKVPVSVCLESTPRSVGWLRWNASPENGSAHWQNAGELRSPVRAGRESAGAAAQGTAANRPSARATTTASAPRKKIDLVVVGTCIIRMTPQRGTQIILETRCHKNKEATSRPIQFHEIQGVLTQLAEPG